MNPFTKKVPDTPKLDTSGLAEEVSEITELIARSTQTECEILRLIGQVNSDNRLLAAHLEHLSETLHKYKGQSPE